MGLIAKTKASAASQSGGVKYVCNVCSQDVTNTVRIRCASKQCPDYDLCVSCFSAGDANLHHDPRTHPYQVIEPHSIPIYDEEWGADEELLLIEGAEQYGLGSWADIADHIGGYRKKDEVRDHYIDTYLNSSMFPLPERASPANTELSDRIPREEFQARKRRRIDERKQELSDTTVQPQPAKPTSSVPSCHEVAGYMPGRLEFESEHFNEAEEAVQHMSFTPDEGINPATNNFDPETELKVVVMAVYNERLTARTDRKRVMFNHKLLDYRKNMAIDKKRTKDQRDLYQKVKPFARIMSKDDFASFADDLEKEQNLRQAIVQLQDWRRMRISTLQAGARYEDDKAARQVRNSQALGQFDRLSNVVRSKPVAPPETATAVVDYTTNKDLAIRLDGTAPTIAAATEGLATPPNSSVPATITIPAVPNITPMTMNCDNAPDLQLLLPEERDLCSKLRLQPKAYLMIKDTIFREAGAHEGKLKKKNVREVSKIDTTKGGRVFEFMVEAGWLGNAARG
ncbi:hypothetical protein AMS68_006010 [Peltaster fructicola]|uniref:Transcriptional adapter 2 n=1 Tax=Peltaster fructicola TaxID=286661 RepID=A0A6H0Y0F8_9PEZI|nr:hypothetical protein AMS68_006010 [Peltaster fructicola]